VFFDGWDDVGRVVVVGVLAYAALVAVLRASGKRTLAKLNAFDLVVTVAFGSTLATIALSSEVSAAEGATAIVFLAAAQYAVARASVRWRAVRRAIRADPVEVFADGRFVGEAMRAARLTEEEVRQAVRGSGSGDLGTIASVVLETDGTLSVISVDRMGTGTALAGIRDRATPAM
jgi:uncharacterized membrane protein YcaP (DUF421 family)